MTTPPTERIHFGMELVAWCDDGDECECEYCDGNMACWCGE